MTWGDVTSSSTPAWSASTSSETSFASPSESFTSGNWNRFVDADPVPDAEGGVDFNNTFSSENPFIFTSSLAPVSFVSNRENPA